MTKPGLIASLVIKDAMFVHKVLNELWLLQWQLGEIKIIVRNKRGIFKTFCCIFRKLTEAEWFIDLYYGMINILHIKTSEIFKFFIENE